MMGSILRCPHPVTQQGQRGTYCIVAIKDKKMGVLPYCLDLSLYIMSSCLRCYSILLNLIHQMHAGQRSICWVIVVDAGKSRSTCHGRDAYIHDHCLRYRHNYELFYQLLNSNLFTHHMRSFKREASSENYGPRVYLLSYYFQIYKMKNTEIPWCNLFTFILFCTFTYLLQLSLSDLILASDHEGIDNPFIALGASV